MKKVIVAGSRTFYNLPLLRQTLKNLYYPNEIEIVCGEARGADYLGRQWAEGMGFTIHSFPAKWKKYGMRAGPIRNREMGEFSDEAVIFWDGESRGTNNMINIMTELGKPIHIIRYKEELGKKEEEL